MHSTPEPMLEGVLLDEIESSCSQLSSNLSYDLPEWITWLLNEQTAANQILFRNKKLKICTGEEVFTWCREVLEECPSGH